MRIAIIGAGNVGGAVKRAVKRGLGRDRAIAIVRR
jgi:hypothetical protein